jgi:hypothetical protein
MTEHAGVEAVPKPIKVGPEMAALRRFLPEVVTWEGTIHEGGMGPGTPAMRGIGRGTARLIQDGRWVAGDYEQDHFLADGTFVLTWQLHWCRAGHPSTASTEPRWPTTTATPMYRGHIEGDQLIFESMAGAGTRLRFTWDASDPGVIRWRNEMAVDDGSWFLIEEYPMVPG